MGTNTLGAWRRARLNVVNTTPEYRGLDPADRKLTSRLVMGHESEDGGITVSQTKIATMLGVRREAANRHMQAIVAAGVFTVEKRGRGGKHGGRTTNRYRLNPRLLESAMTCNLESAITDTPPHSTIALKHRTAEVRPYGLTVKPFKPTATYEASPSLEIGLGASLQLDGRNGDRDEYESDSDHDHESSVEPTTTPPASSTELRFTQIPTKDAAGALVPSLPDGEHRIKLAGYPETRDEVYLRSATGEVVRREGSIKFITPEGYAPLPIKYLGSYSLYDEATVTVENGFALTLSYDEDKPKPAQPVPVPTVPEESDIPW